MSNQQAKSVRSPAVPRKQPRAPFLVKGTREVGRILPQSRIHHTGGGFPPVKQVHTLIRAGLIRDITEDSRHIAARTLRKLDVSRIMADIVEKVRYKNNSRPELFWPMFRSVVGVAVPTTEDTKHEILRRSVGFTEQIFWNARSIIEMMNTYAPGNKNAGGNLINMTDEHCRELFQQILENPSYALPSLSVGDVTTRIKIPMLVALHYYPNVKAAIHESFEMLMEEVGIIRSRQVDPGPIETVSMDTLGLLIRELARKLEYAFRDYNPVVTARANSRSISNVLHIAVVHKDIGLRIKIRLQDTGKGGCGLPYRGLIWILSDVRRGKGELKTEHHEFTKDLITAINSVWASMKAVAQAGARSGFYGDDPNNPDRKLKLEEALRIEPFGRLPVVPAARVAKRTSNKRQQFTRRVAKAYEFVNQPVFLGKLQEVLKARIRTNLTGFPKFPVSDSRQIISGLSPGFKVSYKEDGVTCKWANRTKASRNVVVIHDEGEVRSYSVVVKLDLAKLAKGVVHVQSVKINRLATAPTGLYLGPVVGRKRRAKRYRKNRQL